MIAGAFFYIQNSVKMNIEQVLDYYSPEIRFLLRKYRVIGAVNMETIQRAHSQYGERFMMELLEIITPEDSEFTSLFTQENPFVAQSLQYQQNAPKDVQTAQSGKFWGFWENLLTKVDSTGETINQIKQNVSGSNNPGVQAQYVPVNPDRSKTILVIAGVLILLIVSILLFKK